MSYYLYWSGLSLIRFCRKTGADPRQIFRILRLLQTKGMFRQLPAPNGDTAFENQIFENTPTSDILRAGNLSFLVVKF
jgi:hypothetical protein